MKQQIIITENWAKIQFASMHGCKVTNEKGELVRISDKYPDAVKCYASFPYYYEASAEKQTLFFDGISYDEWHDSKVFDLQ